MVLELSPVSDSDFPVFIADLFAAMGGNNAVVNALYPDNMTAEGQQKAIERFIMHRNMDPSVRWCKITDTELGEIIGVSSWSIHDEAKPPEGDMDGPPGTWKTEEDKEYAQALFRSFIGFRREVFRENEVPVMSLDIMAVFLKHQYRGAGTMMTSWGTNIADEINALCVVEATTAGRWLYEQAGFVVHQHSVLEVPEKFDDRPKSRLFFMLRPRKEAK